MNAWHQLRLKTTIRVRGPFNSKATSMGGYGVDAVLLRTPEGYPLLPGSQLRGRVRDALLELAIADATIATQVNEWFGPAVNREEDAIDNIHRARAWHFSDFVALDDALKERDKLLVRIAINAATGSAEKGMLLLTETAAGPQAPIAFSGTIDLAASSSIELLAALDRLCRALSWIPSLGAFRSVGFGALESFSFTAVELRSWTQAEADLAVAIQTKLGKLLDAGARPIQYSFSIAAGSMPSVAAAHSLEITFDGPICIVERRTDRNISESVDYVRGSVLKGAIAAQLLFVLGSKPGEDLRRLGAGTPWQTLCSHFSNLRFLTAFPAEASCAARPYVLPQSLVFGQANGELRDAALAERPFAFGRTQSALNAPRFQTDWKAKDWETAEKALRRGWKQPRRELRLHTAIEAGFRRAKTEHLFGQEVILPQGIAWRGVVDLLRVQPETERSAVLAELTAFLEFARLRIGKTKAVANVRIGAACSDEKYPAKDSMWIVTLQSPALLVDPRELHKLLQTSEQDPLEQLYKKAWHEDISDKQLELVRFFADQDLQGGFLGRKRSKNPQFYNPYYLTKAGSVFVLKAAGPQAQDKVEEFARQGLPLPNWATTLYGTEFGSNPFLPEDGFGEILVNQSLHVNLHPRTDEVEWL